MLIELAFVACLTADLETCQENSLLLLDMPQAACLMMGPTRLATWSEGHPGWQVTSWRCRTPGSGPMDI